MKIVLGRNTANRRQVKYGSPDFAILVAAQRVWRGFCLRDTSTTRV